MDHQLEATALFEPSTDHIQNADLVLPSHFEYFYSVAKQQPQLLQMVLVKMPCCNIDSTSTMCDPKISGGQCLLFFYSVYFLENSQSRDYRVTF